MMMETMEIRSGDDDDYNNKESSCCPSLGKGVYCVIAVLLTAFGFGVASKYAKGSASSTSDSGNGSMMMHGPVDYSKGLPQVLFDERKYSTYDFENELGIKPAFWGENETCVVGQCQKVWGPCYASINPHWANKTMYHLTQISAISVPEDDDLSGYCRPGFLIIGQGKCGTSSLYHYINGHPRVLPANEKQIHYFKYYTQYPLKWYLSHFPTTASFLGQGALMTGEASPGYLPYPDVVALVHKLMKGTRIVCIGRHPLERAYSSYRYNYIDPAMAKMRDGKVHGVKRAQPDRYYMQWLHSFEDMMRAELAVLKECLSPTGIGITGAEQRWSQEDWGAAIYKRRKGRGDAPLVDLDGQCYGGFISHAVPRKQWAELAALHPEKFLDVPNLHLAQAMIGRSLYVYPLEWWYEMFDKEDIYFMCTEELKDMSGEPLNRLGQHLGLPPFDFSGVVSMGAYNVGEHQGYDKITTWDIVEGEDEEKMASKNVTSSTEEIPISAEFRAELLDFFRPHNERLFKLVGRRCDWDY